MSAPPGRNIFAEYKGDKRIFIETGSYRGDGIQLAIDAGYDRIYSMDNDPASIDFCLNRFDMHNGQNANIKLYNADSADSLGLILQHINEPAVFWLDAHSQMLEGEAESANPWPLLDELRQIADTGIQGHTIIIDDILILTHPDVTGWNRSMIEEVLHVINPGYKFTYLPNPVKRNLLVSHL